MLRFRQNLCVPAEVVSGYPRKPFLLVVRLVCSTAGMHRIETSRDPAIKLGLGAKLLISLLLVTLLYSFASVIWQQARYITDPYVVNDDARVFAVFYTYYDPSLLKNDYLTSYFLSTQVLLGVHALYYVWSQFADPMLLTKILPLILDLRVDYPKVLSGKKLKNQI